MKYCEANPTRIPSNLPELAVDIVNQHRDMYFFPGMDSQHITRATISHTLPCIDETTASTQAPVINVSVINTQRRLPTRPTIIPFMYDRSSLVPLGTYSNAEPNKALVYEIDEAAGQLARVSPVTDYILRQLSGGVTVTRVLSQNEATKFMNGDLSLGSTRASIDARVHTAIHNVTDEFEDSGAGDYSHTIGIDLTARQLRGLVARNTVDFGTYDFLFKDRDPASPFPFDMEAAIQASEARLLLDGYKAWASRVGAPYLLTSTVN